MGFFGQGEGSGLYILGALEFRVELRVEIVRQLRASLTLVGPWSGTCLAIRPLDILGPPVGFSNLKHFEQRNAFE